MEDTSLHTTDKSGDVTSNIFNFNYTVVKHNPGMTARQVR